MASADFDRDGYADLAVGQPGENEYAGAVTLIYGFSRGLSTSRSRRINPTSHIGDSPDGAFGAALVAGDFNRDRSPDLAISAPLVDPVLIPDTDEMISADVAVMVASRSFAGLFGRPCCSAPPGGGRQL